MIETDYNPFEDGMPRFMEVLCKKGSPYEAFPYCESFEEELIVLVEGGEMETAKERLQAKLNETEIDDILVDFDDAIADAGPFTLYGTIDRSSRGQFVGTLTAYHEPTAIEFETELYRDEIETYVSEAVVGESADDAAKAFYQRTRGV